MEREVIYSWDIEVSTIPIDNAPIKYDKWGLEIFEPTNYAPVAYLGCIKAMDMINGSLINLTDPHTGEMDTVIRHRTLREFVEKISLLSKDEEIIIAVQNLGYEIKFLLEETKWSTDWDIEEGHNEYGMPTHKCIFLRGTAPLYLTFKELPNVKFIDTLALSNKSLASMGEDVGLPKLDYNHDIIRTPYDTLTEEELTYNERDVDITLLWLHKFMKDNNINKVKNLPLTFTSNIKSHRASWIKENYKNGLESLNMDKRRCMQDLEFHLTCRDAMRGGMTTSNKNYINKIIYSTYSLDIKSSYPGQMICNKFAKYFDTTLETDPKKDKEKEKELVMYILDPEEAQEYYINELEGVNHKDLGTHRAKNFTDLGYIIEITFIGLKIRHEDLLSPLSHSTVYHEFEELADIHIVNGKIYNTYGDANITISCTNVFLDSINKCFTYDGFQVQKIYVSQISRQLREQQTSYLLNLFDVKESVQDKDSIHYRLAKESINGQYGICVQNEVRDSFHIDNGNVVKIEFDKLNIDGYSQLMIGKEITQEFSYWLHHDINDRKYHKGKDKYHRSFDMFPVGMQVTEYARYQLIELMTLMHDLGMPSIYCDTDSLKPIIDIERIINDKNLQKRIEKKCHLDNDTLKNELSIIESDKVSNYQKRKYKIELSKLIITQILNEVNTEIVKLNSENVRFKAYKSKFDVNEEVYDKLLKLRTWENETTLYGEINPYYSFKTLGAKKYAYVSYKDYTPKNEDKMFKQLKKLGLEHKYKLGDKIPWITTTIAGCNKSANLSIMKFALKLIPKYKVNGKLIRVTKPIKRMHLKCNDIISYYSKAMDLVFAPGTLFSKEVTNKLIPHNRPIIDSSIRYKGEDIETNGGVILAPNTYLLNIGDADCILLDVYINDAPTRTIHSNGDVVLHQYRDNKEERYNLLTGKRVISYNEGQPIYEQ